MDFSLTDDQRLLKETIRHFMEAEIRPILREYEREERFPLEQIRKLGELGCCGIMVPEELGGSGSDAVTYVVMLEEVARVCASTAVTLGVTNSAVCSPLSRHGTTAQKEKYLRRLASGEILGSFCLTEPGAGSDAAAITTRAVRTAGGYRLTGTKTWVSTGGVSGIYLVFAKTDPAAGARGVSAFLVEPEFRGFRVSRYEDKMGLRMSRTAEITFDECEVPDENRLGEEGQGLKVALETLDGGRIGIAAQAVGVAQGALEASVRYAKQRRAFGKTIGDFQAIQWMLADMQTEIEAARGLTYYAAWRYDQDARRASSAGPSAGPFKEKTRAGADAARAKLYSSEMVNRVVYKAVQIHGSMGYSRETDVERMYRDARVITIYEGTSEIQRMVIARDLLSRGAVSSNDSRQGAASAVPRGAAE
ncbi:MAG TPA: acyl-CoA dehydrogenase family protein [Candidatus Acidoferrum sp.]|nr:acyl-CoA dehydrogenase family protein [Candidatus Acidoferrum sp.]